MGNEINVQVDESDESEAKTYEISYLLSPLIPAENLPEAVAKYIKSLIAAAAGEVVSEGPARPVNLAYQIRRILDNKPVTFREAFFGSLRFRSPAAAVVDLARRWREAPELIRHLLIEVPKAVLADEQRSLVRQKKIVSSLSTRRTAGRPDGSSAKPAMSADDMDKEIEQLLETELYVSRYKSD